jgi:hypothetical protein
MSQRINLIPISESAMRHFFYDMVNILRFNGPEFVEATMRAAFSRIVETAIEKGTSSAAEKGASRQSKRDHLMQVSL